MTKQIQRTRITTALAASFVVALATAAGCAVDTTDQEPAPTEEARGRMGKADLPGSCDESQCGGKGSGLCWCDDLCSDYGDCCFNVTDVCETPNECVNDADCSDGFCGWEADNTTRVCKPWGAAGDSCEGFVMPSYVNKCGPGLVCVFSEPTHDVPGTCQLPTCDPTLMCTMAITCVDGYWYRTGCGPANCDEPMGPCLPPPPPPPPATSCEDKCGGPADAAKTCFCDSVCEQYEDCCDDYAQYCG